MMSRARFCFDNIFLVCGTGGEWGRGLASHFNQLGDRHGVALMDTTTTHGVDK